MNTAENLRTTDSMTRNTTTVDRIDDLSTTTSMMDTQSLSAFSAIDSEGKICGALSASDLMSLNYGLQCDVSVLPVVTDRVRKTLIDALAEDS